MGFTVWRRSRGDWERVTTGLDYGTAQSTARIQNSEAAADATGWTFCVTPDLSTPDVRRGRR